MKKTNKLLIALIAAFAFFAIFSAKSNAATIEKIVFDNSYYIANYPDLQKEYGFNNEAAAYNHFMTCGINEGRTASPTFSVTYYKEKNSDLSGMSNRDAYEHFVYHGINEDRTASPLFDLKYYVNSYPDLVKEFTNEKGEINYSEVYDHYVYHGIYEGRNPNANVDLDHYVNAYSDLKKAFVRDNKTDWKEVAEHWFFHGVTEGRKGLHVEVEEAEVAPTCETKGSKAGTKCELCGKVLSGCEEVPALGHKYVGEPVWGEWTEDNTITATFTCANNPEHKLEKQATVNVLVEKTKATCTESGVSVIVGTVEDDNKQGYQTEQKEVVVPALGHKWTKPVINPDKSDCTRFCETCGLKDVTKHDDETKLTNWTPAENNTHKANCVVCNTEVTGTCNSNDISHVKGKSPSCEEPGVVGYTDCDKCHRHASEDHTIPATGHNFNGEIRSNGNGTHSIKCTNMNPGEPDRLGNETKVPCEVERCVDCDLWFGPAKDGKTHTYSCSVCGYEDESRREEHNLVYVPNPDGSNTHIQLCTECGYRDTANAEQCQAFSAGKDVTCEEDGYSMVMGGCEICGRNMDKRKTYKAPGHQLVVEAVEGGYKVKCNRTKYENGNDRPCATHRNPKTYATLKEVLEIAPIAELTLQGDMNIKEDIVIPEGTKVTVNGKVTAQKVENNGNIVVENGAELKYTEISGKGTVSGAAVKE